MAGPLARRSNCTWCRDVRTSQGTFISRHEDKEGVLAWVEEKLAVLTGIPAGHGEVTCPHLSSPLASQHHTGFAA